MIWVLDTSTLYHKPLLTNLIKAHGLSAPGSPLVEPVLPSLAYVERLRQIRRDRLDERLWKKTLSQAGIKVEPFTEEIAQRLDPVVHQDNRWRSHGRDLIIRCHVHGRRVAVTDDRESAWDGLPAVDPATASSLLEDLLNDNT